MSSARDSDRTIWEDRDHTSESFRDADLSDHILRNCRFTACDFRDARFDDAVTIGCTFTNCDFTGAQIIQRQVLETRHDPAVFLMNTQSLEPH